MLRLFPILAAMCLVACSTDTPDTDTARCGQYQPEKQGYINAEDLAGIFQKCGPDDPDAPPGAMTVQWTDIYPTNLEVQFWHLDLTGYTQGSVANCIVDRLQQAVGLVDIDGSSGEPPDTGGPGGTGTT
jgi:hypothetical protein